MYVFSCDCVCGKRMGWVGRKDIKDQRAQIMREKWQNGKIEKNDKMVVFMKKIPLQ